VVGFGDETWWSRLAQPALHTWTAVPLRLVEQSVAKDDPDPKALACYGLLARYPDQRPEAVLLRFVDGRPVSAITTQFLADCCTRLATQGTRVLLLIWDNAPWHVSKQVTGWIREHNHEVKHAGTGVRILACRLPLKSPWLNPIEPKWVHGKRAIIEPDRLLSAAETEERICAHFHCPLQDHLIAQSAA
jgi:transposase